MAEYIMPTHNNPFISQGRFHAQCYTSHDVSVCLSVKLSDINKTEVTFLVLELFGVAKLRITIHKVFCVPL